MSRWKMTRYTRTEIQFHSLSITWNHAGLTQDFAFGHVARDVQQLYLGKRLEVLCVIERPDNFLVARDFKQMWLLTGVPVSEIIYEDRVAVGQALAARHQSKRVAGQIIFIQLPNHPLSRIEFDDFMAVAAGDQQMA